MANLYIVSTPIGNLEDITLRALKTLFTVPIILAEDTRRTGTLLEYFRKSEILQVILKDQPDQIIQKPRFISLNDHNEKQRIPEVINFLQQGQDIALVSDAGTPLISDPGFKLIRECLRAGVKVVPIPGPTAWGTALVASGMPTNQFFFVGYLPLRQRRRKKYLHQLQQTFSPLKSPPTIACYEAPHRLQTVLSDIFEVLGNIDIVLGKELTKLHEKIESRPVSLWIAELNKLKKVKGEYTLLFQIPKATGDNPEFSDEDQDE